VPVFENLNWWEIAMLALVGLFIFGPERLPKVIGDATRMLRTVRQMARNATTELREELGTDIDLEDLHPKTFVRKHLLSEDEEESIRRPLRDAWRDLEEIEHVDEVAEARTGKAGESDEPHIPVQAKPAQTPYDAEAT
jgi:sec-independent protein translocase protein TatB